MTGVLETIGSSPGPNDSDGTTSEGHTLSNQGKLVGTCLTPESGDNKNIADTTGPRTTSRFQRLPSRER